MEGRDKNYPHLLAFTNFHNKIPIMITCDSPFNPILIMHAHRGTQCRIGGCPKKSRFYLNLKSTAHIGATEFKGYKLAPHIE